MADIGVEFAVALDPLGQLSGVIVERGGQLADLVIREILRQPFGVIAVLQSPHPPRQVGDRAHHPARRPQADQEREAGEHHHRDAEQDDQLLLAQGRARHVVADVAHQVVIAPHRQLVVPIAAGVVDLGHVVDAGFQALPGQWHPKRGPRAPGPGLIETERRGLLGIAAHLLDHVVDLALQRFLDQLILEPVAQRQRGQREGGRQAEAQQQKRQDDPASKPVPVLHRDRRSGNQCRVGYESAPSRTVCRPPPAARGYARAGCPNRAVPRPTPGFPAPAG